MPQYNLFLHIVIRTATAFTRILLVGLLAGGIVLATAQDEPDENNGDAPEQELSEEEKLNETLRYLHLFGEVFEKTRQFYVEDVSDKDLVEAAVRGMLRELDPHSDYLSLDDLDDLREETEGTFGGLGIQIDMKDGFVQVVSPIDDTPAAEAGLKAGDLITHLDGKSVQGMSLDEAVSIMRGEVGTDIELTVSRGDERPFNVSITRGVIPERTVRGEKLGTCVGYMRIISFSGQAYSGLVETMDELKEELGDDFCGMVLDLRSNPGGLLDQAVAVADAFLDRGEIVSTRGREKEDYSREVAREGDLLNGLPMVVLIDDGSASAAEIVAGALKDHGRAIIMGTPSFGKGSVQSIINLNGFGAMRLTTSRYFTPAGISIQAKGIEPDIFVEAALIESYEHFPTRREADLENAIEAAETPGLDMMEDSDPSQEEEEDETEGATEGQSEENQSEESPDPEGGDATPSDDEDGTAPEAPEDEPAEEKDEIEFDEEGLIEGREKVVDYQKLRAVDLLEALALFEKIAEGR